MSVSLDRYEIAKSAIALTRGERMTSAWWGLAFTLVAGTNLVDFFAARGGIGSAFAMAALLRIALVFWLGYALIRRMAGEANPGAIGPSFGRFAAFELGTLVLFAAATGTVASLFGFAGAAVAGLLSFAAIGAVSLLLVRLLAWRAALAVGDRGIGAAGAWQSLEGAKGALVTAYLLILALYAVHSALTRIAIASNSTLVMALLAIVDGLVATLQLVLTCALSVTAWRLARERAGALRDGVAVA